MKRALFVTLVILLMAGCNGTPVEVTFTPEPTDVVNTPEPTPTIEDSPTPTPDYSWLDKECIEANDGTEVGANACLSGRLFEQHYNGTQEKPMFFNVVFGSVRGTAIEGANFWWDDDVFWIDATFKHGQYGYSFEIANPGMACHKVVVDTESTINLVPPTSPEKEQSSALNFSVNVIAVVDGESLAIGQWAVAEEWLDGSGISRFSFDGDRHMEFPFYFTEQHESVEIQVMFASIWDLGNHGSTFGFSKIGAFRQSSFNACAGVVGL